MSLEGDSSKQAGLLASLGGLGIRRAGDIAMPSFLASMNSVGKLVETILYRANIAGELAQAVETWRGGGRLVAGIRGKTVKRISCLEPGNKPHHRERNWG